MRKTDCETERPASSMSWSSEKRPVDMRLASRAVAEEAVRNRVAARAAIMLEVVCEKLMSVLEVVLLRFELAEGWKLIYMYVSRP